MSMKERLKRQIYEIESKIQVDTDILGYLKQRLVEIETLEKKCPVYPNPCDEKSLLQE